MKVRKKVVYEGQKKKKDEKLTEACVFVRVSVSMSVRVRVHTVWKSDTK